MHLTHRSPVLYSCPPVGVDSFHCRCPDGDHVLDPGVRSNLTWRLAEGCVPRAVACHVTVLNRSEACLLLLPTREAESGCGDISNAGPQFCRTSPLEEADIARPFSSDGVRLWVPTDYSRHHFRACPQGDSRSAGREEPLQTVRHTFLHKHCDHVRRDDGVKPQNRIVPLVESCLSVPVFPAEPTDGTQACLPVPSLTPLSRASCSKTAVVLLNRRTSSAGAAPAISDGLW